MGAVTAKSLKSLKAPGTASGISGLSGKQKIRIKKPHKGQ